MAAPIPSLIPGIERGILGSALLDEVACSQLVSTFPAERFTVPGHRDLALRIERHFAQGHAVTPQALVSDGASASLVTDCTTHASAQSLPFQVLLLTEAHLARTIERVLLRAARDARAAVEGTADVFEVAERTMRAVSEAQIEAESSGRGETHIRYAVTEALAETQAWREGETTDLAPSGIWSFDKAIGGFPVGELTTLAAMTGAGKTSLLMRIVVSVALAELARAEATGRPPAPVVVFSAEMSRKQITHRAASALSGVNLRRLRTGTSAAGGSATDNEFERYEAALARLSTLTVHLDDEPAPTFAHIAARLHQVRQSAPVEPDGTRRIALVGVDYDEKINTEGASEELRVSAIAQGLKNTAKRFGVATVGLSQYSRQAVPNELPSNAWLRYSGKKEHESAMIVHWMWPQYWASKGFDAGKIRDYDASRPERGWLVVTKNRFGPEGQVKLDFDPATTSFRDPAEPGHRYTAAELARRPAADRSATSSTAGEDQRDADAWRAVDDSQDTDYGPPGGDPF